MQSDALLSMFPWGDPTVTSTIFLDRLEYTVTTNLKSFLQHIQALLHSMVKIAGPAPTGFTNNQPYLQALLSTFCPNGPLGKAEEEAYSSATVEGDPQHTAESFARDIAERNHQVQRMKHIYRSAARTFVWLGDYADIPRDEVEAAFDFIMHVSRQMDNEVDKDNLEERTAHFFDHFDRVEADIQLPARHYRI
ncbi:hypothetical protein QBC43DRAFT_296816 [Cladorrhinum sp. PSN259]|nr:hypothetical protein QBC43DRAFT_296816 [Cladorrhinum sp. PSN259]